jgi:hypothetical protein
VTHDEIVAQLPAISEGVAAGVIRVLDPDGRPVDLSRFGHAPPALPAAAAVESLSSPPPAFQVDDANRDVNPMRPTRISDNQAHAPAPSPFAQGAVPELLRTSLEAQADAADAAAAVQEPAAAVVPEAVPTEPAAEEPAAAEQSAEEPAAEGSEDPEDEEDDSEDEDAEEEVAAPSTPEADSKPATIAPPASKKAQGKKNKKGKR